MSTFPTSEEEGQAWAKILKDIDPWLASFAETQGLRITRDRWDMPSRQLSWYDPQRRLQKNINLYVQTEESNYYMTLETHAWRDTELESGRLRERHWCHQESRTVLPKNTDHLSPEEISGVSQFIEREFETVSSWEYSEDWTIHKLPARSQA